MAFRRVILLPYVLQTLQWPDARGATRVRSPIRTEFPSPPGPTQWMLKFLRSEKTVEE